MPIYAYRCDACGFSTDVLQKMGGAPLVECPECHASAMKKQVTSAGFQLKGSGWYQTDFRNSGAAPEAKSGAAAGGAGKSDDKSGGDSKTESKGDSKPESKAELKAESKADSGGKSAGSSSESSSGSSSSVGRSGSDSGSSAASGGTPATNMPAVQSPGRPGR